MKKHKMYFGFLCAEHNTAGGKEVDDDTYSYIRLLYIKSKKKISSLQKATKIVSEKAHITIHKLSYMRPLRDTLHMLKNVLYCG